MTLRTLGRPRGIVGWLVLAMMLSVLIQAIGISFIDPIGPYDSMEYLSIAESLFLRGEYGVTGSPFKRFDFQGETPTRMRQPGYPLYLVVFYWLGGGRVWLTQISQVLLSIGTIYLIFRISRATFGQEVRGETLLGIGGYFPLWLMSAMVVTEPLFTFLLALFMYVLLNAITDPTLRLSLFLAAGGVAGLTFLVRPIALLLAVVTLLPIALHVRPLRRAVRLWGALALAFAVTVSPWVLRNAVVFGELTVLPTEAGFPLWASTLREGELRWRYSPEFKEAVRDGYYIDRNANQRFMARALERIGMDPVGHALRRIQKLAWVWSYFPGSQSLRDHTLIFGFFTTVQVLILGCAAIGLSRLDAKIAAYYLLPPIALSCVFAVAGTEARHIVPSMPFVLVLSGQGFGWLASRLWARTSAGATV